MVVICLQGIRQTSKKLDSQKIKKIKKKIKKTMHTCFKPYGPTTLSCPIKLLLPKDSYIWQMTKSISHIYNNSSNWLLGY